MWDLPGPGIEPVSPALAGGSLTTVPPGKPGITVNGYGVSVWEEEKFLEMDGGDGCTTM